MRFEGLSATSLLVPLSSVALRKFAAIFLVFTLAGCGFGGAPQLANNPQERSHNKLATKVLADIAIESVRGTQSVRGTMPARIASRRGRDTL